MEKRPCPHSSVKRQPDRVVAIDLNEVLLVDRGAVKLLELSESNGAELRNCPASVNGSRERGEHEFVGARNRKE
jgi:hypothetical protein